MVPHVLRPKLDDCTGAKMRALLLYTCFLHLHEALTGFALGIVAAWLIGLISAVWLILALVLVVLRLWDRPLWPVLYGMGALWSWWDGER